MSKRSERKDKKPGLLPEEEREGKVRISPMKKDGEKMMLSIEDGNMAAILSGKELMYTFIFRNRYQCFIHPLEAPEGRRKDFEINERNRAMLKNLDSTADQIFEIGFEPDMDFMGVMVAAERGIISYLDMTGQLPVDDMDFMSWQEPEDRKEED